MVKIDLCSVMGIILTGIIEILQFPLNSTVYRLTVVGRLEASGIPIPIPKPRFLSIPNPDRKSVSYFFSGSGSRMLFGMGKSPDISISFGTNIFSVVYNVPEIITYEAKESNVIF